MLTQVRPPAAAPSAPLLPTDEVYPELQRAYDWFNRDLFEGALAPCLITLQRKANTQGYFAPERFVHRGHGSRTHELALNPVYFAIETVDQTLQTLVHEMTHLWQMQFGKPGRRGYHNREWADKLESLGLMPSDTGRPGGKRLGEAVGEYQVDGGPFQRSCAALVATGFRISWLDRVHARAHPVDRPVRVVAGAAEQMESDLAADIAPAAVDAIAASDGGAASKKYLKKYRCEQHRVNLWGKRGLRVLCGHCQQPLEEL